MLIRIANLPAGIDGFSAAGTVTHDEYRRALEPIVRAGHVRLVYELGPELAPGAASAAWEDLRASMQYLRAFEGCAIVTDHAWIREATRLVAPELPCPVRVFATNERDDAIAWLAALAC
jgi:SpoIIAA-like